MIDTADSRFAKAVAIADNAGQWLKCRTRDGRKAYGIRSSRDANRIYLVTRSSCTCEDAARHPGRLCKHELAVQLHCARVAVQPMPASATVDGLAQMASDRGLDKILGYGCRHAPKYETDHVAAARYDDIFRKFED